MNLGSRAGLTLMELMVAIAITGAVAALGYQGLASLTDHREKILTATLETERAAALRETLHEWMTNGQIMIQAGAAPPLGVSGGNDVLTVRTTALTPSLGPMTFMRLFVDDDPATPERGLTMQYQGGTADTLVTREVAPEIAGMWVEFLDARTSRWYPSDEAATIQPTAARVTLEGTEEAPLHPILQLPLAVMMQDEPRRQPT